MGLGVVFYVFGVFYFVLDDCVILVFVDGIDDGFECFFIKRCDLFFRGVVDFYDVGVGFDK